MFEIFLLLTHCAKAAVDLSLAWQKLISKNGRPPYFISSSSSYKILYTTDY